jgi:two-component system, NarL family, sensor histidine kinase UhpB
MSAKRLDLRSRIRDIAVSLSSHAQAHSAEISRLGNRNINNNWLAATDRRWQSQLRRQRKPDQGHPPTKILFNGQPFLPGTSNSAVCPRGAARLDTNLNFDPTPSFSSCIDKIAHIDCSSKAARIPSSSRRVSFASNSSFQKQKVDGSNGREACNCVENLMPGSIHQPKRGIPKLSLVANSHSGKILVVDNDPNLVRLIEKTLKREGFTTAVATSGREAIDWLARNKPDLMLMDLNLHDIKGRRLINHLDAIRHPVRFIIITDQSDERVAVEMIKRGALDYLVKSADFIELVPIVVRRALTQIDNERRLALVEKQARLTGTVVEQSPNPAMIAERNGSNPCIQYVNRAFTKTFDCSLDDVVGKGLVDLEALTGKWRLFRRALLADNPMLGEMQLHARSGKPLVMDCTITKVLDHRGVHTHWALILRDFTERKRLEREILEISDREQSRIGRDLHDGLGQQLTALELFTASLKKEIQAKAPELIKPLEQIGGYLREAIRQTRGLATGLSPTSVHDDGLPSALRRLATSIRTMAGVDCDFTGKESQKLCGISMTTQLYRIAQEAVTNALKHGHAKKIRIALRNTAHGLELKVADNGRGFLTSKPKDKGLGLRAMKYRADLIGATLSIYSASKKGTEVICTVPK